MPYQHSIDPADRLVTVSGHGGRIVVEAADSAQRMLVDPRIDDSFGVLVLADPAAPTPSADDVVALADLVRLLRTRLRGRIAIVTSTHALADPAALVSLLGSGPSLDGGGEVRAFTRVSEARRWVVDSR
jgi:hypothetical protein